MKCFKCNHENPNKSNFCSKCGKSFQSTNQNSSLKERKVQSHILYPQPEAMKTLKSIKEKKSSLIIKLWIVYLAIIISSGFIAMFTHIVNDTSFFIFFGIFLTILILIFTNHIKTFSKNQYYSIPTSLDEQGQHRCVFCGNKGIYKSTIYKTTTTVNACSKCKEILYHN